MDKIGFFSCKICKKVFGLKHYLDNHIEKKHSKVNCPYCSHIMNNIDFLDSHISVKHMDKWSTYIDDKEVELRLYFKEEKRCKYCGFFFKNLEGHINKCLNKLKEEDIIKEILYSESKESLQYWKEVYKEKIVYSNEKYKHLNINSLTFCRVSSRYFCSEIISQDKKEILSNNFSIEENNIGKIDVELGNSKDNKFYCERCNKPFKNIDALNQHMASKKHFDDWEEYFNRDDVTKRLLEKKLVHCKDKHQLIKESNLNKSIQTEDKIVESEKPKLKEQILKHKSEIEQYDENINDELLTDEEEYYDNIRKKIEYNTRNYEKIDREKILKQYVYTTKRSAIDTTLRNEIRSYLYETYRGYCQICGFTFRKSSDNENSFEMHNWDNKLVVKSKSYLVSSADSLCLCRNCSANIKFGAFDPLFVDRINNLKSKSIDEVKELICNKVDRESVVDRFQEFYEWEDIYALEITVNNEPKNIYMTSGHLIQFIAYLQLEEKIKIR